MNTIFYQLVVALSGECAGMCACDRELEHAPCAAGGHRAPESESGCEKHSKLWKISFSHTLLQSGEGEGGGERVAEG